MSCPPRRKPPGTHAHSFGCRTSPRRFLTAGTSVSKSMSLTPEGPNRVARCWARRCSFGCALEWRVGSSSTGTRGRMHQTWTSSCTSAAASPWSASGCWSSSGLRSRCCASPTLRRKRSRCSRRSPLPTRFLRLLQTVDLQRTLRRSTRAPRRSTRAPNRRRESPRRRRRFNTSARRMCVCGSDNGWSTWCPSWWFPRATPARSSLRDTAWRKTALRKWRTGCTMSPCFTSAP
mmetsp:Transcript_12394/g.29295  ORF Transcript_12394/g.29295 Transcript_12394/m.29295 type:complete len:233 (-) Transcript_12394:1069-1767(-)